MATVVNMEPNPILDRVRAEGCATAPVETGAEAGVEATGAETDAETSGAGVDSPSSFSRLFRYWGSALISI